MDRRLWTILMASIRRATSGLPPRRGPGRRVQFADWLIAAMYFWAVWHDRCLSWACDRCHYGGLFRPRRLPSVGQFARRVQGERMRAVLQAVHDDLAARGVAGPVGYVDGKPLAVSPVSKDPDAARGHVSGGFAKGYKLHAYVNENRRVVVWSVMPLNADEKAVAAALLPYLPPGGGGPAAGAGALPLTLGDSNYDSAPLHKDFAAAGQCLFAPLRAQQRVKGGKHHPVTLRQMGPQRREAVAAWDRHPDLANYVMKQRNNIEGVFSVLTVACNLGPPPAFVRTLPRVTRWVGAKIILYHARLLAKEQHDKEAA